MNRLLFMLIILGSLLVLCYSQASLEFFAITRPELASVETQKRDIIQTRELASVTVSLDGTVSPVTTVEFQDLIDGLIPVALDFRPNDGSLILFACDTAGECSLFEVSANGTAAFLSELGCTVDPVSIFLSDVAMDINPLADRLRIIYYSSIEEHPVSLRIDIDTGNCLVDGTPQYSNGNNETENNDEDENALFILAAGYTNNFPEAASTELYVIDSTSDAVLARMELDAGDLTVIGPLGLEGGFIEDGTVVVGFDIVFNGTQDIAFALDLDLVTGTNTLHLVDLNSGAAFELGQVPHDESYALISLAIRPPPLLPTAPPDFTTQPPMTTQPATTAIPTTVAPPTTAPTPTIAPPLTTAPPTGATPPPITPFTPTPPTTPEDGASIVSVMWMLVAGLITVTLNL